MSQLTVAGHGEAITLPNWLHERRLSNRPALFRDKTVWSYRELYGRSVSLAGHLARVGLRAREPFAVLARHGLSYAATLHAVSLAGGVLVPLNTRLAPAECAWQVRTVGARVLAHDRAHAELAWRIRADLGEAHPLTLYELAEGDWEAEEFAPLVEDLSLDAVQSVVFTSGTTGKPKGALITYGNQYFSASASAVRLGLNPSDRWLVPLPLFHVGGQAVLMRSVIYGTAVVLQDAFDPVQTNRMIDESGATLVSVVAMMLDRMMDARGDNPYPPALRSVLLGGGPAPRPLLLRALELGVPVQQSYGLTETNSQVATLSAEDALRKLGSAGTPLSGAKIRIALPGQSLAKPGEVGEIEVRGPTVIPTYLPVPGESETAFRNGYLRTGDLGYLDDDGYLFVVDRRSDLVISGGENVYPAEVEAVLLSHESILEAGVTGVPDAVYGAVPAAVVRLRPNSRVVAAEDLMAFCRSRLAGYKVPKHIVFADELPRNATGKLLRRDLQSWFKDRR